MMLMRLSRRAISTSSPEFQVNAARTAEVLRDFRSAAALAMGGGSAKAIALHRSRNKLLARERIEALIDPGSPFLELSPMAAWSLDRKNETPSAGIVTGIGLIEGRHCMVVANDPTVKGGTYLPLTIKKHLRAQKVALENHLPCVYLVESGGGNLSQDAADGSYADETGFGRIFYNQARLSAMGAAQVAVVLGSCTAGGAYVPAMSDEVVIVRGNGTIFLAGPPLVKAATGEVISAEELGGGEVHCRVSGVADHLANDEPEALRKTRAIIANLPRPRAPSLVRDAPHPPAHDPSELHGLIPADSKQPMDMRAVVARIVDAPGIDEFKAEYGGTLITGFAKIDGYSVGVIANDGILHSDASVKGAHFVQVRYGPATPSFSDCPHRTHAPVPRTAVLPAGHATALFTEHHRIHGGARGGAWRHRPARCEAGARGELRRRAEVHSGGRWLFWRGQLRHVRPCLLAALHVDVAKRQDCRHGR